MSNEDKARAIPWRKRHPVLSRAILYVLGACVVAGLVHLFLERSEQDRQDRWDYLEARLGQLDLVLLKDPSGAEVLKILDEEFGEEGLPGHVRQGVLRARATVYGARGEFPHALLLLSKATPLATSEAQRFGIAVEAARLHLKAGQMDPALDLLQRTPPGDQPVLAVWAALARAELHVAQSREDEARTTLDAALERLPRPLPGGPPVTVAMTPWTPAAAAHLATRELTRLSGEKASGEPWRRLLELAPGDFDVVVSATRALLELGFHSDARAAWRRAEALDPAGAAELAGRDPTMAELRGAPR